jgi:hypothetical protein
MAEKRTGLTVPAGILQSTTMQPEEPPADEGQGIARDDGQDPKALAKAPRRSKIAGKASSGKVEGRKLYLTEDVHFRLRMLAYQRGQKLSECAVEVLDKALPKWNVDRIG